MTIRGTILLLGLPLFLLLAGLNAGLLFLQERTELKSAQQSQALAAAITVAEFLGDTDPAELSAPARQVALRQAVEIVPALESLYVVSNGRPSLMLKAPAGNQLTRLPARPATPQIAGKDERKGGILTAVAPVPGNAYVVVDVDARPRSATVPLSSFILLLFLGAGAVGLIVSILFARMVTRELAVANRLIDTVRSGKMPEPAKGLRIREIRELADAVELMATTLSSALSRMQRRTARKPDLNEAVAAFRGETMGAATLELQGAAIAVRQIGAAPPGAFYALAERDGRGGIVLGRCGGEDAADALANALRARHFFTHGLFDRPVEESLALSRAGHDLQDCRWRLWSDAEPLAGVDSLLLADPAGENAASGYAAKLSILSPAELAEDLVLLLAGQAAGLLAVMKPLAGSPQRDREDVASQEQGR